MASSRTFRDSSKGFARGSCREGGGLRRSGVEMFQNPVWAPP